MFALFQICNYGIEKHMFDVHREVGCIFQDYPILFLEMSYMGNKELQMWDLSTLNHLYSVQIDEFNLRYLGLKNWLYWCHIGTGKGQLTYGSILDLMDKEFFKKKVIEDDSKEEVYLSFLTGNTLIFSRPPGTEMKVYGLEYETHPELL